MEEDKQELIPEKVNLITLLRTFKKEGLENFIVIRKAKFEKLLKENENLKQATIINKNLYEEVCNKNKELEIEKESLEDKVEYKNKIIRQQNDELGVLQAQLYSYKENLGDVCNKNAELEKELKHKNDLIKQADKDLEADYVPKSLYEDVCNKNKELEEENKKYIVKLTDEEYRRVIDVAQKDCIPKSLIKEIRDKAEFEDYYTLPNVIDDLDKILGDEK